MPSVNSYHSLLISKLQVATRELEIATENLRAYEEFLTTSGEGATNEPFIAADPAPQQAPAQAAPETAKTEEAPVTQAATPNRAKKEVQAKPVARPGFKKDGTPKKKPGPQKGATKAAQPTRAQESSAAAQPAQKVTKAEVAASTPSEAKERSKPGPKASTGESKPSLIEAISIVLGDKHMNVTEVMNELTARNWLPNSGKPQGYVAYALSKNKDRFLRDSGSPRAYYLAPQKGRTASKAAPVAATQAQTTAEPQRRNVDNFLANSGIKLDGPNPFALSVRST